MEIIVVVDGNRELCDRIVKRAIVDVDEGE